MTNFQLIDLSHTIEDGLITYRGLPAPVICDYLSREESRQHYAVGIDSLNIDDTADGLRPAHTILLGAGIPIVEHLCGLQRVPDWGFTFHAVPVKVKGLGTFPVRAFAVVGG